MSESPWHTKYGQFSQFDPNAADNVMAGSRGLITHPGGNMTNRDNNNFEPRLGLAWRATNKLVVRTGFALIRGSRGCAESTRQYSISTTQSQVSQSEAIFQISQTAADRVSSASVRWNAGIPGLELLSRNTTITDRACATHIT